MFRENFKSKIQYIKRCQRKVLNITDSCANVTEVEIHKSLLEGCLYYSHTNAKWEKGVYRHFSPLQTIFKAITIAQTPEKPAAFLPSAWNEYHGIAIAFTFDNVRSSSISYFSLSKSIPDLMAVAKFYSVFWFSFVKKTHSILPIDNNIQAETKFCVLLQ